MWNKLSSKTLFSHPRITLIEDEVELSNGQKTNYLRFDNISNVVAVIGKREDGKILMQREYAYPPNQKLFQFPGGAINLNENLESGANRELREESKLKANNLKFLGKFLINNRRSDAMVYTYLGTDLVESYLDSDIEEEIENFWFSEEEITDMIREGKIIEQDALASWAMYLSQEKYKLVSN